MELEEKEKGRRERVFLGASERVYIINYKYKVKHMFGYN